MPTSPARRLPPLLALRAFEAAARHSSFTRAAEELCVTQAAVSRHVRSLETHFGQPLFIRSNRSVRLTHDGQRLYEAVNMGFSHIAGAAEELMRGRHPGRLTVAMRLAFASLFMAPRIGAFRELHPEIELFILTTEHNPVLVDGSVDVAISLAYEPRPGREYQLLFNEEIFPVCSPHYLSRRPPIRGPHDLAGETLLHMDSSLWLGLIWKPVDWAWLLGSLGVSDKPDESTLVFNNYHMMMQTAIGGGGIGIGWLHLVKDLLDSGNLVRPIPESVRVDRAHYLVVNSRMRSSPAVRRFCDWIVHETEPLREYSPQARFIPE